MVYYISVFILEKDDKLVLRAMNFVLRVENF